MHGAIRFTLALVSARQGYARGLSVSIFKPVFTSPRPRACTKSQDIHSADPELRRQRDVLLSVVQPGWKREACVSLGGSTPAGERVQHWTSLQNLVRIFNSCGRTWSWCWAPHNPTPDLAPPCQRPRTRPLLATCSRSCRSRSRNRQTHPRPLDSADFSTAARTSPQRASCGLDRSTDPALPIR